MTLPDIQKQLQDISDRLGKLHEAMKVSNVLLTGLSVILIPGLIEDVADGNDPKGGQRGGGNGETIQ